VDISAFITGWAAVFGGGGLLVVAAFLVERKKGRIETIAPVLARIFTPLFFVVMFSLLVAMLVTGRAPSEDRDLLISVDLLLALVLGLTLYTMSARDAEEPKRLWDVLTLALVGVAVVVDGVALAGIASRLAGYGTTPNRLAALGENVFLLIDLLLVAIVYGRFIWGRLRYQAVVEMQMRYLLVYAVWAAAVVIVFPPVFGFR
jgi:FtsH-binding integral membrane protein